MSIDDLSLIIKDNKPDPKNKFYKKLIMLIGLIQLIGSLIFFLIYHIDVPLIASIISGLGVIYVSSGERFYDDDFINSWVTWLVAILMVITITLIAKELYLYFI